MRGHENLQTPARMMKHILAFLCLYFWGISTLLAADIVVESAQREVQTVLEEELDISSIVFPPLLVRQLLCMTTCLCMAYETAFTEPIEVQASAELRA